MTDLVMINIAGDGQITKEIIREGAGPMPVEGDKVKVHYIATVKETDTEFDNSRSRGSPTKFVLGDTTGKAWCAGIYSMKVGELSKFTVGARYAYGEEGLPGVVTPDSTIVIEAELLEIMEKFETTEAAIARANEINDQANTAFRSGEFQAAIDLYTKELDFVEDIDTDEARDVIKRIYRNISTSHGKLENWKASLRYAQLVLDRDSSDLKAIVRKVEALIGLRLLPDARKAISAATKELGKQTVLRTLVKAVEAAEATEKKEETERFAKMLRK